MMWLVGEGPPRPQVGVEGDIYLDRTSGATWGPRALWGWPLVPYGIAWTHE